MEASDLATAIGGTSGAMYALYRIERLLVAALAKRSGKANSNGDGDVLANLEWRNGGTQAQYLAARKAGLVRRRVGNE